LAFTEKREHKSCYRPDVVGGNLRAGTVMCVGYKPQSMDVTLVLSVIVPVYNERKTLGIILTAISRALSSVKKEIVVIDDCSTDGTREWLKSNFPNGSLSGSVFSLDDTGNLTVVEFPGNEITTIHSVYHDRNLGKGSAVRTGFALVSGDVIIIQDADLEYDPNDWSEMYDLITRRKIADVVFGSRFYGRPHRSLYFHHYVANRFISLLFNIAFNQTLTDIECCYKMMTKEVAESLRLTANDFGIEIEMSAEIARKRHLRIYELGITYYGRTYAEGKKISWIDGMKALWYVLKYRFR
jgi:glycosyltransferase involved in cell wall biosynthesis